MPFAIGIWPELVEFAHKFGPTCQAGCKFESREQKRGDEDEIERGKF